MSQQYKSHDVVKVDTRLLPYFVLLTVVALQTSADTPESYLKERWYSIEIVVFEKVPSTPTPELVTNAVEKRVLPASTIAMQLSEKEFKRISEFSKAVNFDAAVDEFFFDNPWHVPPTRKESPTPNTTIETNSKYLDGCWMHLVNLEADHSTGFESLDDWSERISNLFENDQARDPRLPDWLPDVWQTFDQNLTDSARALGLCDEDLVAFLDEEYQDFIRLETIEDKDSASNDEQTDKLTNDMVRDAFEEYETELIRTALTPQSSRLNLQQTASRLRNNSYRIIDHFSWHQDGQARGSEPNVLAQFGEHLNNGFREVEGIIAFSVARFLHLKVNLWRFVSTPLNYDPAESKFSTPVFFYEIQESRRLALGEIHYFDHPKFGVLVQIRRVPIPDDLKLLVEQFKSSS